MREIKFRGISEKIGKFVYGYYYRECDNEYIIEDRQKESMLNRNVTHKVAPETVGQYTGLKDCNDKDIYEGDIIKSLYPDNNVVIWDDDMGMFGYYYKSDWGKSFIALYRYLSDIKIIGNMFENKELTK